MLTLPFLKTFKGPWSPCPTHHFCLLLRNILAGNLRSLYMVIQTDRQAEQTIKWVTMDNANYWAAYKHLLKRTTLNLFPLRPYSRGIILDCGIRKKMCRNATTLNSHGILSPSVMDKNAPHVFLVISSIIKHREIGWPESYSASHILHGINYIFPK